MGVYTIQDFLLSPGIVIAMPAYRALDLIVVHCGLVNVVAPSFFQKSSQAGGMVTATGNSAPRPPDGAARKTRGGNRETR
jgi:hypothetical protein